MPKIIIGLILGLCATSAANAPQISAIIYQRSPCLGSCPVFKLQLNDKGKMIYVGETFVRRHGIFVGQITPEEFQQIAILFQQADFFNLKGLYRNKAACGASTNFALRRNGRWYKVKDFYNSGPPVLRKLEQALDALIKKVTWKYEADLQANTLTQRLIEQINERRSNQPNLKPLTVNPRLVSLAEKLLNRTAPDRQATLQWKAIHYRGKKCERLWGCRISDPAIFNKPPIFQPRHQTIGIAAKQTPRDRSWCIEVILGPKNIQ